MQLNDTIVAVSSPAGQGGVRGIVRLSGPGAWALAGRVAALVSPAPGFHSTRLTHPRPGIPAGVLLFKGPRSFTGQDIAELHVPQSSALLRAMVEALLAAGARHAEAGEFTARAFFNGKLDLTEAEGIAATIAAAGAAQLRAAASLRAGDLHRWTADAAGRLADLLALVEAGIDFVEEEGIDFVRREQLEAAIGGLRQDLAEVLTSAVRIDRLDVPPTVVFTGLPNVGKSSLINALAGTERSIVSPEAGTTRDLLAATLLTPGGEIRLVDMPGEEEAVDALRAGMMAAREGALLDADLIVEVLDACMPAPSGAAFGAPWMVIRNKADLLAAQDRGSPVPEGPEAWRLVSARTGLHLGELRDAILRQVGREAGAGAHRLALNHRHRQLLVDAGEALDAAALLARGKGAHPELLAAELRQALDLLGAVTGTISPDDVLGRIFGRFCIGK